MMFQNCCLSLHMSCVDYAALDLRLHRVGKAERRARARECLEQVHLGEYV